MTQKRQPGKFKNPSNIEVPEDCYKNTLLTNAEYYKHLRIHNLKLKIHILFPFWLPIPKNQTLYLLQKGIL